MCTVQAPHCAVSQPTCVPVSCRFSRRNCDQQRARVDGLGDGLAVDGEGNGNVHAGLLMGNVREAGARNAAPLRGGYRPIVRGARGIARMGFPNAAPAASPGRRRYGAQLRKPKKPASRSGGSKPRRRALRRLGRVANEAPRSTLCDAEGGQRVVAPRSGDEAGIGPKRRSPSTRGRRPSESRASRPDAPPLPTRLRSAAGDRPSGTRHRLRTS